MSTTWINRGHLYAPHVTPVIADCVFQVQAADSAGLGITNLKGQAVQNVFMHTSTTPGAGPNGYLNPNPAAGFILVQLSDNYSRFYGAFSSFRGPTATSTKIDNSALTIGQAYIITIVGNATDAQWRVLGVPKGVAIAVGVSFIAIATTAGTANTSTSRVQLPSPSGIQVIEHVGAPSLSLGPVPVGGSPNVGGWLLFNCLGATSSSVTTLIPTAPADGSVIHLDMYLNQSSVIVAGE